MMFRVSITLQWEWCLWPPLSTSWFYTRWVYCEKCYDHGRFTRRALTILLQLPYAVLTITTPAWFSVTGHFHRPEGSF